jgi:hypothetical protein
MTQGEFTQTSKAFTEKETVDVKVAGLKPGKKVNKLNTINILFHQIYICFLPVGNLTVDVRMRWKCRSIAKDLFA